MSPIFAISLRRQKGRERERERERAAMHMFVATYIQTKYM